MGKARRKSSPPESSASSSAKSFGRPLSSSPLWSGMLGGGMPWMISHAILSNFPAMPCLHSTNIHANPHLPLDNQQHAFSPLLGVDLEQTSCQLLGRRLAGVCCYFKTAASRANCPRQTDSSPQIGKGCPLPRSKP